MSSASRLRPTVAPRSRSGRVLIALLGLAATVAAHAAFLYQSDFGSMPDGPAAVPGWSLSGGEFGCEDGWLTVTSERDNPAAVLPVRHGGDPTFRATARGAVHCHWSALLARGVYRLEVNN